MAPSANKISIILLLTLLSSLQIHARDGQFFNKVTSTNGNTNTNTNTNTVIPETKQPLNNQQSEQPLNTQEQTEQQQRQPDFIPDNENGYGLYGHESGQLPPSTTTLSYTEAKQPLNRHLPKNYNPVAYVTVPENVDDSASTLTEERSYATNPTNYYNGAQNEEKSYATNPTNYYNGEQNYYNGQQTEEEAEYRRYPTTTTTTTTANNRNNYNLGSSFNSQPLGQSDTRYNRDSTLSNRENYFNNNNNNGNVNGFRPQGMSDTRALENGKYFYDVNTEKYSTNHPYESLRGVRPTNEQFSNRNYYSNSENVNEFSNENYMGGYQNQEEFQTEDNSMP